MTDHQRRTSGRGLPSTSLSLLGIVRHLGKVERRWIRELLNGETLPPMWGAERDADFDRADAARAEADVELVRAEWDSCDRIAAGVDLDTEFHAGDLLLSLRFLHYHLFHEYSRHNGHADLLRQAIDGVTGR